LAVAACAGLEDQHGERERCLR